MVLEKQKTYMVLNYNSSPVSLLTKDRSYLLEGGTKEQPAVLPLTIDEIYTANTNGCAFKCGLAFFDKEFEEAIYEDLRIINWRNILRDEQIEDIILNPTKDGLEKLIAIDNEIYFNRVYGIYMGLKSVFSEISPRVELVIEQRHDELRNNQRQTEIIISKPENKTNVFNKEMEELKERLAKMEVLLNKKIEDEKDKITQVNIEEKVDKPKQQKTTNKPKQQSKISKEKQDNK